MKITLHSSGYIRIIHISYREAVMCLSPVFLSHKDFDSLTETILQNIYWSRDTTSTVERDILW